MLKKRFWVFLFVLAIRTASADDAKALLDRAFQLTKTAKVVKEYDQIIQQCQDAQKLELSQDLGAYARRLLAWTHNRRGEAYSELAKKLLDEGDGQQSKELDNLALEDFEEAVRNDPDRWKALHNRGVSYALMGKYDKAIKDFGRVIDLKSDYVNAWFNRAEIHFELQRYAEALRDYDKVVELDPDDSGALRSRGRTLLKLGKASDALMDLDQALKLENKDATALVYRGEAYQMLGQWDKAFGDFRKAIEIDVHHGRAYLATAWLLSTCPEEKFRNSERALQAAHKSIELDQVGIEGDYRYWDVLAAAYANANQFDEAISTLDRVSKSVPNPELSQVKKRRSLYAEKKPYRLESTGEKRR